jgi:hypothetical protein
MKTPKEKAKEYVLKFKKHANGFVGSSMLTNTEYTDSKFNHAKEIAKDVVSEILDVDCRDMSESEFDNHIEFYNKVLEEITILEFQPCELCESSDFLDETRMDKENCWFCKNV